MINIEQFYHLISALTALVIGLALEKGFLSMDDVLLHTDGVEHPFEGELFRADIGDDIAVIEHDSYNPLAVDLGAQDVF